MVASLCAVLVFGGYQLYSTVAIERFRVESHLEGKVLASHAEAKFELTLSALDLFVGNPHLSTYVASGGPLPPYSKARIDHAMSLLRKNLEVQDWTVMSFSAPGNPRPLKVSNDSRHHGPISKLAKEWSLSKSPKYQVRDLNESEFLYAAPVLYRDEVVGCFLLILKKNSFAIQAADFHASLRHQTADLEFQVIEASFEGGSFPDRVELQLPGANGEWELLFDRSPQSFRNSSHLRQARMVSVLVYFLLLSLAIAFLGLLSRRAALQASKTKSDFLSNISHEIRNPLSGIMGLTNLTLETELNSTQEEYLRTVSHSAQSLMSLLNDLLDHSKMEAGALDFTPMPISLREVIVQTLELFKSQTIKKSVELSAQVDEDVPDRLLADPLRLQQLLGNLIGNSLKFTDSGQVTVQVRKGEIDTEGRQVLKFSVADTGCGIASEQLERIFEAFQQADETTPQVYGGTGLGLSISREFVHRMGGEIRVESQLGQGTVFHFTLHLKVLETSPRTDGQTPKPLSLNILLAEDSAINQKIGTLFLEELGHSVVTASNGLEVLELVDQESFDLIFMDLNMPRLNGIETTKELRARGFLSTPIVALTGNALREDQQRCLRAGMDHYLIKPMTKRSFYQLLSELYPDALLHPSGPPPEESKAQEADSLRETFDAKACFEACGSNINSFNVLINVFIESVDSKLNKLESSLSRGELSTAQREAQVILESLHQLHASHSLAHCRQLIEHISKGKLDTAHSELEELRNQIEFLKNTAKGFQ